MSGQPLRPLKKRGSFSPVLWELTIVILLFALSASVVVQLIAAAGSVSGESEYHSRALLAMETVAERTKADPEGDGAFDERNVREFAVENAPDLIVDCVITRDPTPRCGTLYDIALSVTSGDGTTYQLSATRYVSDTEAPQ